ncbi:MobF family relaxase [Streptomyces sp. NPDC002133]|uniref:MobF family relaxase n=1 Tax=Streptomyces sp. NPDC002133 TaxID=3154409 RepID=UPI00332F8226
MEQAQDEAGVPPGVWIGRALPAVGLTAGTRVTEQQMRHLFGEGRHPDANRIVAARLAAGDRPAEAQRAAKLGYRIQRWSGGDLVFRPPGSVQALWALAASPVRQAIEAAHSRVIGEVLAVAETEHLWVRVGRDSTVQPARPGVIAARFRHYQDRDGGPLLHDHVVLSVKVIRADGQWGTLHTRPFLEYAVALSELYNQRLMEELCTALDLATVPHYPTAGQRPVMELAGIPEQLIDLFATRNAATMRQLAADEDTYRSRTGRRPTVKVRHRMMARASHTTRPAKPATKPLPVLRARWRDLAVARYGQALIDGLLDAARAAARVIRQAVRTTVDIAAAALEITAIVAVHHGGTFRHRHLLAEARRYLARTLRGHPAPPLTDTTITSTAIRNHCLPTNDQPDPDQPLALAHRAFTPAWLPDPTSRPTTPTAHRLHDRARAEAFLRTVRARTATHLPQTAPPAQLSRSRRPDMRASEQQVAASHRKQDPGHMR